MADVSTTVRTLKAPFRVLASMDTHLIIIPLVALVRLILTSEDL